MQTTRLTLAQLLAAHLVAARAVGGEMNNGLLLVRGLLRVVAVLLRGLGLLLRRVLGPRRLRTLLRWVCFGGEESF